MSSIAIIGAGLAGLACARALRERKFDVTLFEKARGPGGRLSSRRLSEAVVDIGAQYFTARHADFRQAVHDWQASGLVAPWPEALWTQEGQDAAPGADGMPRYCAAPRMSALSRHLAEGLRIHAQTRIQALHRDGQSWWLESDGGERFGPFVAVAISAPPPQAQVLVEGHDAELARACGEIEQQACWAAYALLDSPLPVAWQALQPSQGPLAFVGRNHTKPGREAQGESLTLHATPAWSRAHLEASSEAAATALFDALAAILPASARPETPRLLDAHRWRYARPARAAEGPGFRLRQDGLALCGDGWAGGRVEDAWRSGHHLGRALAELRLPLR
ncbi:NAD(P)/FAD-dependent oxidoreductase [Halomonas salifodinae]|uniref:NAD(P)/FAD-dependent oxidoreductase n=1 Tax=Halomonas salifodinae TaxID=438745 RepID=UPI0033A98672